MQIENARKNRLLEIIENMTGLKKIHAGIESELNAIRIGEVPESEGGMAQLIDPQGNRHIIVRRGFAERWCIADRDWTFEVL